MSAPSKLILTNQFGEESVNVVSGAAQPLVPGASNIVSFSGATAPVDGTTGATFAGKGSIYIAEDTGAAYRNTGSLATPAWTAIGTGNTSTLLTGLSVSAGLLAATDTILQGFNKLGALQNGTFVPTVQTLSAAGAINLTSMVTLVNNATGGTFAMTLAAPSSQDGQLKVIKLGTATTNGMTLAMTNIKGPGFCTLSGTTTLTFTSSGQCAILMAVGAKWMLVGGDAVAS